MRMQTELRKVRGTGSAKSGTEHFWHQRLSAIANVPLLILVCVFAFVYFNKPQIEVYDALHNPMWPIIICAALLNMCWHMKLGLQMVIEDYVHGALAKTLCLLANVFLCFGLGLVGILSVLKMSFGFL